jgi:hypothetical protein
MLIYNLFNNLCNILMELPYQLSEHQCHHLLGISQNHLCELKCQESFRRLGNFVVERCNILVNILPRIQRMLIQS